jgi:hypothetical protein
MAKVLKVLAYKKRRTNYSNSRRLMDSTPPAMKAATRAFISGKNPYD